MLIGFPDLVWYWAMTCRQAPHGAAGSGQRTPFWRAAMAMPVSSSSGCIALAANIAVRSAHNPDGYAAFSWFKESYGIVRDDEEELQTIRIRAFGQEVFYMRDLPFHCTQKEVETTEDWSDFELQIRPTADFFSPLLSRGPLIQVMEPQWLADEIKRQHLEAAGLYE